MNKIFKYAYSALAAVMVIGTVSCSNDDHSYTPALPEDNAQVYFSNETEATVNATTSGQVALPVCRVVTTDAITVPLTVKNEDGLFNVPTSISFAAGQAKADLVLTYDFDKVGYDNYSTITIAIDPQYATVYGVSEFTFTVGIPAPWKSIGKGIVYDNFYMGNNAKVEFYQNEINPNLYRIASPTIPMLKAAGMDISADASAWLYVQILQKGDVVLGQTIEEDGLVLFYSDGAHDSFNTGLTHSTYNDDICWVFPGIFTKYSTPDFWAYNKVLDYKSDGTPGAVQLAPFYYMWNTGGWDKTQADEMVTIYFPGYEVKDYELDINFVGRLIDSKENGSAVFDITLGADVAYANYLMDDGQDPNPAYNSILEGAEGVEQITASAQITIPYTEAGTKTLVVVAYNADGKEIAAKYLTINIPEGGDAKETWTAILIGDYYHCVQSYAQSGKGVFSEGQEKIHEGSVLYISDQDEERFKISPWIDGELIFTCDAENQITVLNQNTGVYDEEYDTYIAATDLITAKIVDYNSEFADDVFWFELVWHDLEDVTAANGAWGYTEDAFVLTGEASAPSHLKMCTPKNSPKLNLKKTYNYKLEMDMKSFAPFKNFAKLSINKGAKLSINGGARSHNLK